MTRKERNKRVGVLMVISLVSLYAIGYLLIVFAFWDIFSPFQWIEDVPRCRPALRVTVLIVSLLVIFFDYLIVADYVDRNEYRDSL